MAIKPREIWEKGTPLSKAWSTWATEENRETLLKIGDATYTESNENKSFLESLVQFSTEFQKLSQLPKVNKETILNMKRDLIECLSEEDLYAFGFPILPNIERSPRRINSEFWINAKINWDEEIASDGIYEFHKITITDPEDFPEIDIKPKIGRKSHKSLMYEAIGNLFANDPNFEIKSHKIKAQLIRGYIEKYFPEINPYGPGLGDDAIRKNVNIFFKNKN